MITALVALASVLFMVDNVQSFERVCYMNSQPDGPSVLKQLKVSPDLCTRINVLSVSPNIEKLELFPDFATDFEFYDQMNELKSQNPSLKVLVMLGAANSDFDFISRNQSRCDQFATNVLKYLLEHKLDGLDVDWEFPFYSTGNYRERNGVIRLLKSLSSALKPRGLILSVAVPGDVTVAAMAYDGRALEPLVDYINVMAYDLFDFKKWWPFTGYNSALFARKNQKGYFSTLNTATAAAYWHDLGINKSKLMVGVPTYAHSYELYSDKLTFPGAPSVGDGLEYTYGQVCQILGDPTTKQFWDDEAKVPYAVIGNIWISYENRKSVYEKALWIKNNGYGGSMVYNLNSDDFENMCGSEEDRSTDVPFRLTSLIANVLNG